MRFGFVQVLGVLALAGCASAPAPETAQAPAPAAAPRFWTSAEEYPQGYLTDQTAVDAAKFLPPKPAENGTIDQADQAILKATRVLEGTPRWDVAAIDATLFTPDAPRAFECALGTTFVPEKAPTLTYLLARILPDVQKVQKGVKSGASFRTRPYVRDGYNTCVEGESLAKSSSYPSGHTAIGWSWALILAELAPDRADAILKRGVDYGQSRVVCGFHYPSDLDSGRMVGAALVSRLHTIPEFQKDLEAARRELAELRASTPPAERCAVEEEALSRPAW